MKKEDFEDTLSNSEEFIMHPVNKPIIKVVDPVEYPKLNTSIRWMSIEEIKEEFGDEK